MKTYTISNTTPQKTLDSFVGKYILARGTHDPQHPERDNSTQYILVKEIGRNPLYNLKTNYPFVAVDVYFGNSKSGDSIAPNKDFEKGYYTIGWNYLTGGKVLVFDSKEERLEHERNYRGRIGII